MDIIDGRGLSLPVFYLYRGFSDLLTGEGEIIGIEVLFGIRYLFNRIEAQAGSSIGLDC